jgi:hypothetical protein
MKKKKTANSLRRIWLKKRSTQFDKLGQTTECTSSSAAFHSTACSHSTL